MQIDVAEYRWRARGKCKADVFKKHIPFDRGEGNVGLVRFTGFFRRIHNVGQPFKGHPQFLHRLPDRGKAQDWLGDIATDDAEGNQLAEGEFSLKHHRSPHPKHK